MVARSRVDRVTFAGGEIGPQVAARADLAKYQIAVAKMENFVVLKGGGATRAPGTRMVLELKDQSQRGKLIGFRRTSTDYYALVVNAGVSRLVRQGGFVQNPDTTPFEFAVPWAAADLPNLRSATAGNSIYVASATKKPQVVTRTGALTWAAADYAPNSGPVDDQNVDTTITIQSNATNGNVTLTGVNGPFSTDYVGGVMRIDDPDLSLTPEWTPTETAIATGQQRRWNGNVYEAIGSGDAGPNPPVHTSGSVSAGSGKQIWLFRNPGYGFIRITAVTNSNSAAATTLTDLPKPVTTTPSYRWSAPAWTAVKGYPEVVAFNSPRLGWYRGNSYWETAIDDAADFDPGVGDDGDAISGRIIAPDGSLVEIKWALPSSGILVLGTSDIEWVLRGAAAFDPLTPKTARAFPVGSDGSAPQIASAIDGGVMFLGTTRKRLHYTKIDPTSQVNQLNSQELSVVAEHIFAAKMVGGVWQRDPQRVFWMWFDDGTLASLTFMPEQQVAAFARHPRTNFFVEDMVCIPSVSSGTDEVYLIVRRTIAGQTKRYVEQMADYFMAPQDLSVPTAAGAWFVDCGLAFSGSGLSTITQLAHLEGQEVAVFADGAMQKRKTVTGGAITLDRPSDNVLVGLPLRAYLRDLPRNFNTPTGATTGEQKTARDVLVNALYAGGGAGRVYDSEEDNPELWEPLIETGAGDYVALPPLFSGLRRLTLDGKWDHETQTEFQCDDALPCTLLGLSPDIEVAES